MLFVGDDWAEDHHDVYLMNDAGDRVASRRLPEGLAGIGRLHELIAEHAEDLAQVVIGIETDRGLWVDALTAAGYQVFAINPLAAARYRDRHHVSGAKSDPSDAKLLADLVRTDRHNHRPIAGDSDQRRGDQGARPGASESDLGAHPAHQRSAQCVAGVLPGRAGGVRGSGRPGRAGHPGPRPYPRRRRRLSLSKIRSALKAAGRQRNLDTRALQIQEMLRTEQLAAPAAVTAAFGASTRAAVGIIAELNRQIADLEAELATHFEAHPDADIYRSLPGLGVILGARVLGEFGDDPNRYTNAKCRKNYAGTSPLTIASGRKRAVLARHIRNNRLYDAIDRGPSAPSRTVPARVPTTTSTAPLATCTTKPYAPSETGSSASCTAAYATTPTTTNTKPGHTDRPRHRPLDNLRPWDV